MELCFLLLAILNTCIALSNRAFLSKRIYSVFCYIGSNTAVRLSVFNVSLQALSSLHSASLNCCSHVMTFQSPAVSCVPPLPKKSPQTFFKITLCQRWLYWCATDLQDVVWKKLCRYVQLYPHLHPKKSSVVRNKTSKRKETRQYFISLNPKNLARVACFLIKIGNIYFSWITFVSLKNWIPWMND